ncbi:MULTISPECIES: spore germination protein [unclassified Lysinibacillus]|uniref:spore germination protein n=1 Tax=unclassified Lysinibacillus TaxID=2636778 RepID=UPI00088F5765|nr:MULTISPECIES: spore germination protein [unclassified Lysinibacillus]SCY80818.1 spore germination protein KA [Lysinibacillus sp. SG9]SDB41592.1 spore germination protein KA [Lysinibacillus sp. TC-37]SFS99860.1 spore germination protein KA [Lysinibacillus sp. SG55]
MDKVEYMMKSLQKAFYHSSDLTVRQVDWHEGDTAILCFYASLVDAKEVQKVLDTIYARLDTDKPFWSETLITTLQNFSLPQAIERVCQGETIVILPETGEMLTLSIMNEVRRNLEEPNNEHILRGSHEGLIERADTNLALIRKRVNNPALIVKSFSIGHQTKTKAYYLYMDGVIQPETLQEIEKRIAAIQIDYFYSIGQLSDALEDSVLSPFPQLLHTEHPDRVVANLVEGKVVIMTNISPSALIGPVTFFSFYQTPDDYNGRVVVGSFYKMVRLLSFVTAVFLPAFYIAVISFHFEVLPLELSNQVKNDVNDIPYRPLIEALILEIIMELIRESSIRLPQSVGQTIGIVGGLVIGDAIVSAGLVSNLMVIVVALTAISSYVVPSVELNSTIRMLRFPFMVLASLFGFLGIVVGIVILLIHLISLTSLKQPYFSPIVPFQPKAVYKIFLRWPFIKPTAQVTSFQPPKDEQLKNEDTP